MTTLTNTPNPKTSAPEAAAIISIPCMANPTRRSRTLSCKRDDTLCHDVMYIVSQSDCHSQSVSQIKHWILPVPVLRLSRLCCRPGNSITAPDKPSTQQPVSLRVGLASCLSEYRMVWQHRPHVALKDQMNIIIKITKNKTQVRPIRDTCGLQQRPCITGHSMESLSQSDHCNGQLTALRVYTLESSSP